MDFTANGNVDRNDAFLLSKAIFDQVRFIEDIQLVFPDHRNGSTECSLNITFKLLHKNGDPDTGSDTKVFLEFSSTENVLLDQLKSSIFQDRTKLVQIYDGRDGIWRGLVRAVIMHNGVVSVQAKHSLLQVVTLEYL